MSEVPLCRALRRGTRSAPPPLFPPPLWETVRRLLWWLSPRWKPLRLIQKHVPGIRIGFWKVLVHLCFSHYRPFASHITGPLTLQVLAERHAQPPSASPSSAPVEDSAETAVVAVSALGQFKSTF
jgi:hypothetical protein